MQNTDTYFRSLLTEMMVIIPHLISSLKISFIIIIILLLHWGPLHDEKMHVWYV